MKPWSTTSVTSQFAFFRRAAEVEQRLFVDEVEREVVELRGLGHGDARPAWRTLSGSTSRYSKNASVELVPKSKK